MKVYRRYMHNSLRNFNYLIGCETTREAIALDPLDGEAMVRLAEQEGYRIRFIINTHEHHDHVEGNPAVVAATGAQVLAHKNAIARIPGVDRGLSAGDTVELGSLKLRVLHTPGHTPVHVCLLVAAEDNGGTPALFSGDTLFNACAGNCRNGGDVDEMYDTFVSQILSLPDETLLYPGHDYMKNNLAFALTREPDNTDARYWQAEVAATGEDDMPLMTLGQERLYNPFLRLHSEAIRQKLKEEFPALGMGDRDVFRALWRLRDEW